MPRALELDDHLKFSSSPNDSVILW